MNDIASLARAYCSAGLPADMTIRQIALLGFICDRPGPHRVRHLAAALGIQKPVVCRALDTFERLGIAIRPVDPADRRDRLVLPTGRGRDFRAKLAQLGEDARG